MKKRDNCHLMFKMTGCGSQVKSRQLKVDLCEDGGTLAVIAGIAGPLVCPKTLQDRSQKRKKGKEAECVKSFK